MRDIIITGCGCAGMTAALYSLRAGMSVMIFEKENIGGKITAANNIENYPGTAHMSGMEFSDRLFSQINEAGAEFALETVTEIIDKGEYKTVVTEDGTYDAKAVIIAAGTVDRKLGIDREEELTGRGVSYCALCDGAFFAGKTVAVAGGGNTAFSDALYLAGMCKKVYIIHRRKEFRAEASLVEKAKQTENIELITDSIVTALRGESKLSGVTVRDVNTGRETNIGAEGLFAAIGHIPETKVYADLVELDGEGYIKADENGITSRKGIYAAGDCRTKKVRQLTTAAADGAAAAVSACAEINSK